MRQHDAFGQSGRSATVRQKRHVIGGVDGGRRRKGGAIIGQERRQWNHVVRCGFRFADDDEVMESRVRFLLESAVESRFGRRQQIGGSDEDFGGRDSKLKAQFVGDEGRVGGSCDAA